MTKKHWLFLSLMVLSVALLPTVGYCGDVENALGNVRDQLVNRILPLLGTFGIIFAAFSFFTGNPGARTHLMLAIVGAIIGFSAEGIMTLIQRLVH